MLEGANIKLASVATGVPRVSGRAMLAALAESETDPKALGRLARGRVREKTRELQEALRGLMGSRQRFMLVSQLGHLEYPDTEIEGLDSEVARRVSPFEATVAAVDTIPRVGRRTAQVIAAEVGTDMKQFPTPGHLASWAGVVGRGVSGEPPERGKAPAQSGTEGEQLAQTGPRFHEGRLWWRRPRPPDGPRPTWEPNTGASPGALGPSGRRWRWPTASP